MVSKINYWLPKDYIKDEYKFRLIITSCMVSMPAVLVFLVLHALIGYYVGLLVGGVTMVSIFIILALTKRIGSTVLSGNYFAFQAFMTILLHSLFTSDYLVNTEMLIWLVVSPISGFLYANTRSGIFWLVITLLSMMCLYIGEAYGVSIHNYQPQEYDHFVRPITITGFVMYLFMIIQVFDNQKSQNINDLNDAFTEISRSHEEIHQRNEEIRQQQEEMLAINENVEAKNKALNEASDLLKEKNLQITDSIRYAQTIQEAILPFEDQIAHVFDEYFIIYKAKDIVSGDFYWLKQQGNRTFFGLGDCTGHGVPGAFMSIIGYSLLNDLVLAKRLTDPAQILNELHECVKRMLNQENKMNSDGMDLAFCCLECNDNLINVSFAGAKLSLYYVESESKEVVRIKGNNRAIGGYQGKSLHTFQSHHLELKKGSTVYMFSDGFADQNNHQNKKFGSKYLKELIESIQGNSLEEQHQVLLKNLENHMQGVEQRDDITFLAFKV